MASTEIESAYQLPPDTVTTITVLDTRGEGFLVQKTFADISGTPLKIAPQFARRFTYKHTAMQEVRRLTEKLTCSLRRCLVIVEHKRAEK